MSTSSDLLTAKIISTPFLRRSHQPKKSPLNTGGSPLNWLGHDSIRVNLCAAEHYEWCVTLMLNILINWDLRVMVWFRIQWWNYYSISSANGWDCGRWNTKENIIRNCVDNSRLSQLLRDIELKRVESLQQGVLERFFDRTPCSMLSFGLSSCYFMLFACHLLKILVKFVNNNCCTLLNFVYPIT